MNLFACAMIAIDTQEYNIAFEQPTSHANKIESFTLIFLYIYSPNTNIAF